jgi:hypothetical protein
MSAPVGSDAEGLRRAGREPGDLARVVVDLLLALASIPWAGSRHPPVSRPRARPFRAKTAAASVTGLAIKYLQIAMI